MSETIRYTNIALEIFGCLIALIIIISLAVSENHKSKLNRLFMCVAASVFLTLASDATALIFRGGESILAFYMVRIANFGLFSFGYFMALFFTNYLAEYISTKKPVPKIIPRFVSAICLIAVLLVVISQFNGMYYFIDENNLYRRGDLFGLSQVIPILCMIINAVVIIAYRKVLNKREFFLLISYIILPVIAMAIQINLYGLALLYISAIISLLMIYIGIQANVGKKIKEKEHELAESRIAIMLSQIQPHFLYHSLAAISRLCDKDPAQAKKVTIEFAEYLRGNLESLTENELIPFEKEISHTEAYLNVERATYGKTLNVVYNIEVSDFQLPPLTLQPIVENAVKHGISRCEDGGTVAVSAKETVEAYIITITDNGTGFETSETTSDARQCVGIENTRRRLASMCGGTLKIESEPGAGTTVAIEIPKGSVK